MTAPADAGRLSDALAAADAVGFVCVAPTPHATIRYLAGPIKSPTPRETAFVAVADETHLFPPEGHDDWPDFEGTVHTASDAPVGRRAAVTLGDRIPAGGTVLVPRWLPHDAALHLESAGFDLASTTVVDDARASKRPDELEAVRTAQRAAVRAVARSSSLLAEATSADGELRWEDAPLSPERLRRQVNAALATEGVSDGGGTSVTLGGLGRDRAIDPGETVTVRVAPRGRSGYHGALARTFVVDGDGGWERRAAVAVESALDTGAAALSPGVDAMTVRQELLAELGAYGFDVSSHPIAVYGVGLDPTEAPVERGSDRSTVDAGAVVALAPVVAESGSGTVAATDLFLVDDDGACRLDDAPRTIVPTPRRRR